MSGTMNDYADQQRPGEVKTQPITLDVREKGKTVRLEFVSETDREGWRRAYRKSRWYMFYFMVGVGINLAMYFAGLDLSRNILLGALVGLAVPIASMLLLTELHFYLLDRKGRREKV
ncbi:MAG: hypothetical protein DDT21_00901 [Syntrophomonadaceae bacterium]|nr:hypothetical protein [Bacillota bacterium]